MKKALLSLLTLSTLATPAMAGYQVDGYHLMDGSDFGKFEAQATPMINTLEKLGVPVLDGGKNGFEACKPQDGKQTLGFYSPRHNFMVVCTTDLPKWIQMETLTHEAVHVLQDLRDGIHNDTLVGPSENGMKFLAKNLSEEKATTIVSLYDREDWEIEAEAFFLEDHPKFVTTELNKFVF